MYTLMYKYKNMYTYVYIYLHVQTSMANGSFVDDKNDDVPCSMTCHIHRTPAISAMSGAPGNLASASAKMICCECARVHISI